VFILIASYSIALKHVLMYYDNSQNFRLYANRKIFSTCLKADINILDDSLWNFLSLKLNTVKTEFSNRSLGKPNTNKVNLLLNLINDQLESRTNWKNIR
jgi:hypothetical protein